ncbi:hypothetical protein AGR8A_pTi20018 [Agrobacterium fabrum str. J-07]|nr:hypothetical protein AGR8A_pTi20018 [Agrobacterium fabrum str. J-07]
MASKTNDQLVSNGKRAGRPALSNSVASQNRLLPLKLNQVLGSAIANEAKSLPDREWAFSYRQVHLQFKGPPTQ